MIFNRVLSLFTILLFFSLIFASIGHSTETRRIGLQDLRSRVIVYCYDNSGHSAEECAAYFEKQGYTQMRNIPSKTAKYDFLTVDTYPTRRWRDGETTPRW